MAVASCAILVNLVLIAGPIRAVPGVWSHTYGGMGSDSAGALVQTVDGGYVLAGRTGSFGAGSNDFWLVKVDALGNLQWNRTYGGAGNDEAEALVQAGDGGFAVAGRTTSFGSGNGDFWLVRTNVNGDTIWNKTYGGISDDIAEALIQTGDGGFVIVGGTQSFGAGNYDVWLVKTDASGNALWNRTYGGGSLDSAEAVVQTVDGGYLIAGATWSVGAGNGDVWLIKTDVSGNVQWNRTYGGTGADMAHALLRTNDGGYAVAAYTESYGAGASDFWLIRVDASGNMQWNKTYGGRRADWPQAMVQSVDGRYAIVGYTESLGAGASDFWLVNTDASGNALWNQTYGGTGSDWAEALVQADDGGYAIAGRTASFGAGGYDFWLVKTDPSGAIPEFPSTMILVAVLTAVTIMALLMENLTREKHRSMHASKS